MLFTRSSHPVLGPKRPRLEQWRLRVATVPLDMQQEWAGSACSPLTQRWSWFHSQPRLLSELPGEEQRQLPYLALDLNPSKLARGHPELRPRDVVEDLVSCGVPIRPSLGAKQASQLPGAVFSVSLERGFSGKGGP